MTARQRQRRDSFETLDLDDVEVLDEVRDGDGSGPRAVPPPPKGLWSDVPPPPPPRKKLESTPVFGDPALVRTQSEIVPKLPKAPPLPRFEDDAPTLEDPPRWERESDRVSLDGLVADLSTRRPPPQQAEWDLPLPESTPSSRAAEPTARARSPWLFVGVAVGMFALGLGVPYLLGWRPLPETAPPPAAAATLPTEEPAERVEPVVIAPAPEATVDETAVEEPLADEAAPEEASTREVEAAPAVEPARTPAPVATRAPRTESATERTEEPTTEPEATEATEAPVIAADPIPSATAPVVNVAPRPNLPDSPMRTDVEAAMASVRDDIHACGDASTSGFVARVRFTFSSEGRVTHAVAQGVNGPAASCIARAARGAQLSPFARDRFVVEYPFTL